MIFRIARLRDQSLSPPHIEFEGEFDDKTTFLVFLRHETKRVVRLLVPLRFLSGRKSDLLPRDLFVRNSA
jgi:hypothetical protein